jgi:glycerophosphoryl diester phosphodiesterase
MHSAPENTLAGFRACLALRVGLELDVQRTKDGELVCLHDTTLDRTTSGSGLVLDKTYDELRRLDAGKRFAPQFGGERVPLLKEVIEEIARLGTPNSLIAVDIKDTPRGVPERVVQLAAEHKILDRIVFIGATVESPELRARLRVANARSPVARLATTAAEIPEVLSDKNADWVYVRFIPSREEVDRVHESGKRVFIAGPLVAERLPENWQKASAAGIDAILTDYPLDLAQQVRDETKKVSR